MSKTTKIVAALGIVAGLGVAALPAFTYALDSISGDVEVQVEVPAAIAMTITGNNDNDTTGHHTSSFAAVIDPSSETVQLYTYDNSTHLFSEATYDPGSTATYYKKVTPTLSPVATYDGMNEGDKVDGYTAPAEVTGTSSSYARIFPGQKIEGTTAGETPNNFSSIITVYTNNNSGYALSVKDKDEVTDLTHADGTFYIPTTAGTLTAGTKGWNFDSTPDSTKSSYAPKTAQAMPAASGEAITINQMATKTSGGSATTVDYNVATDSDQAAGIYSDIIVYTATANV